MSRSDRSTRAVVKKNLAVALLAALILPPVASAQRQAAPINFETYDPVSMLVVPGAPVERARFPFIDVHSHQRRHTGSSLAVLVRQMDALNMAVMVNLSGGSGEPLQQAVALMDRVAPGRFATFANLNFRGIDDADWGTRAAAQLEQDVRVGGAKGLKIFKNLGMDIRDAQGRRIPTNDPRFDPVWAKAGELGIPVLIHTAEPPAFFLPPDSTNERLLELRLFPNRAMPQDTFPPFETLMAEQHAVFRKHRNTTFINAHLGWYGQDLARLGQLFDEFPNMVAELGAVIYEPGRQPRTARAFFIEYQDRILMGKDSWIPAEYGTYFRVLESADEYFPYHKKYHAFWRMYGLELPDAVLRKIYFENALRVVPGLDRSRFPR